MREGAARLEPYAAGMLAALTRAVDWVWIVGNHDSELQGVSGGAIEAELEVGGMLLRHEALPGETRPELSGHFHPKFKLRARGRSISRPCAVIGSSPSGKSRMILPAFGALTGGMNASDPAIVAAMQPAQAIDAMSAGKWQIGTVPAMAGSCISRLQPSQGREPLSLLRVSH